MNPITTLKLAGPISVKLPNQIAKPKNDSMMEPGAFSKLLSSVKNEEEPLEGAASAELLAELEKTLDALEQLPPEDLPAVQQELLYAMINLLHAIQAEMDKSGQKPDYVVQTNGNPVEERPLSMNHAAKDSPPQRIVELMQQIAHEVENILSNTTKEFGEGPIFMGVEKEYILKDTKKVNETIKILEEALSILNMEQAEESGTSIAKLLGHTVELVKQDAGSEEEKDWVTAPKNDSQPVIAAKFQGDAVKVAQAAEKPEPAALTPAIRLGNLAEDLSGVLKSSLKLTGSGENTQIKVSIFPEHLGHLEIRLSTVDGKVAAQIFTSNPLAKEALDLQIYQLRNAMVQQGITVDRIEISQQPTGQSFNHQQEQRFTRQQSQQNRQAASKNGYQRLEEETAAFVRPASSANLAKSVDYTI